MTQPLWSQWAISAVEQRNAAEVARKDLIKNRDGPSWYLEAQREMRSSMLSLTAGAFAIEGWGFSCIDDPTNKTLGASGVIGVMKIYFLPPRTLRHEIVSRVNELFTLRGELVHHKSPSRRSLPHPILGRTPYESATYTFENARRACGTVQLIINLCLEFPNPDPPPQPDAASHARVALESAVF